MRHKLLVELLLLGGQLLLPCTPGSGATTQLLLLLGQLLLVQLVHHPCARAGCGGRVLYCVPKGGRCHRISIKEFMCMGG